MDDLPGLTRPAPQLMPPQLDGRAVLDRSTPIGEIGAIGNSNCQIPGQSRDGETLHDFVLTNIEQPLQKAVEKLLNSGVLTLDSSANSANAFLGFSQLTLDYKSLPPEIKFKVDGIREYLTAGGVPETLGDSREFTSTELYVGKLDRRSDQDLVMIFIPTDFKTTLGFIEDESMKFVDAIIPR